MERRMVRTRRINSLNILMNGYLVGTWQNLPSGAMNFQYAEEWLETDGARPISLSMPLRRHPYEGDLVYNFFDNLLPDSREIRARIQKRFSISTSQPFDLLTAIGADCVGAIQICQEGISQTIETTQAQAMSTDEVARYLEEYKTTPIGTTKNNNDFRISIAGAQEKTALLWHESKWCRPIGTTPTSHIFKFPIGIIPNDNLNMSDSCENEWLCLQIAKAFGLPTAEAQIQHFDDVKVLVVERFDRQWSQDRRWLIRLPQEDMCQALGMSPNLKYQNQGGAGIGEIMKILLGSEDTNGDREKFFRSQILFWLLAATDGHSKNFSIYINQGGSYRLTPLYDVISVYPFIKNKSLSKRNVKMSMSLRGEKTNYYNWDSIQPRHFISTAKAVNFSEAKASSILEEMLTNVDDIVAQVNTVLPENFPAQVSQPILDGMLSLAKRSLNNRAQWIYQP
jgi:serine/threonine-protein kinase HipA